MTVHKYVHVFLEALGVAAFLLWLAAGTVVGMWAADRAPPRTAVTATLMSPDSLRPGDTASVEYQMTVQRHCPATIHRRVVTRGAAEVLPPRETRMVSYEREAAATPYPYVVTSMFEVPRNASAGPGFYQVTAEYRCNPIHTFFPIVVEWEPVRFRVAPD